MGAYDGYSYPSINYQGTGRAAKMKHSGLYIQQEKVKKYGEFDSIFSGYNIYKYSLKFSFNNCSLGSISYAEDAGFWSNIKFPPIHGSTKKQIMEEIDCLRKALKSIEQFLNKF